MSCITTIRGEGVNPGACSPNGIQYVLDYVGRLTAPVTNIGGCNVFVPRYPDGSLHPSHRFTRIDSIVYSAGCAPPAVSPNQPFDCLNGGCVAKTTYNTPGVFANLEACQSGCAKNSNCAGECVSPAQMAALQSATNNLISRYCK